MTKWDWILSGTVVAVAIILQLGGTSWATAGSKDYVSVIGPYGKTLISLSAADSPISVQGQIGTVVFEVRGGALHPVKASCPDGVCLASGPVGPGRPVVCAPNGIIAYVSGASSDYDVISR